MSKRGTIAAHHTDHCSAQDITSSRVPFVLPSRPRSDATEVNCHVISRSETAAVSNGATPMEVDAVDADDAQRLGLSL
jgi:hypothetical protein